MLSNDARKALIDRVQASSVERSRVRDLAHSGQWMRADDDEDRVLGYLERMLGKKPLGAESLQGDTVDFQSASFLPIGARIRRAVAYIEVVDAATAESGTGFMITPRLFITNQHVIADDAAALHAQITFDRESDETGRPRPATSFLLDPGAFALYSLQSELDYAIVAVGKRIAGDQSLSDFGYCPLSNTPDRHVLGMNVNIVQHPNGLPKMISVRNNLLTYRTGRTLLYETDTQEGSSGSPVFNDAWDLVALHHWGQPFLELKDDKGASIPNNVNEGIRISAIYEDLVSRLETLPPPQRALLSQALDATQAPVSPPSLLGPPHPSAPESSRSPWTARTA